MQFCMHLSVMAQGDLVAIAEFLRMFKSLEVMQLMMPLARRLGSRTASEHLSWIRQHVIAVISQMQSLRKVLFGKDYIGYDMMWAFLEQRGLQQQLDMLKSSKFLDSSDAFLQNSICAACLRITCMGSAVGRILERMESFKRSLKHSISMSRTWERLERECTDRVTIEVLTIPNVDDALPSSRYI